MAIPGTLILFLTGANDGVCVWSRERGNGQTNTRYYTDTTCRFSQWHSGPFWVMWQVSPEPESHSQEVCFSVRPFFEGSCTAGVSLLCRRGPGLVNQTSFLPCDSPQKLSWCWGPLWDVVSNRLLRANPVWWYPLLRELRWRQLRQRVPSQMALPGQRGGSEKTAQDWKWGKSHNCSGFSYTF